MVELLDQKTEAEPDEVETSVESKEHRTRVELWGWKTTVVRTTVEPEEWRSHWSQWGGGPEVYCVTVG